MDFGRGASQLRAHPAVERAGGPPWRMTADQFLIGLRRVEVRG
jgi:hypothetical protein